MTLFSFNCAEFSKALYKTDFLSRPVAFCLAREKAPAEVVRRIMEHPHSNHRLQTGERTLEWDIEGGRAICLARKRFRLEEFPPEQQTMLGLEMQGFIKGFAKIVSTQLKPTRRISRPISARIFGGFHAKRTQTHLNAGITIFISSDSPFPVMTPNQNHLIGWKTTKLLEDLEHGFEFNYHEVNKSRARLIASVCAQSFEEFWIEESI